MPKHDVYIEPFLGAAAVMKAKRPAAVNIGLDLDPDAPGLAWIASQRQTRAEVMCDPTSRRVGPDNTRFRGPGGEIAPRQCEHGLPLSTDEEWEDKDPEFYEACDCCGAAIEMESYGSFFEGDPNNSRLLCTNCYAANEKPRHHHSPDLVVSAEPAIQASTAWRGEVGDGLEFLRNYSFTGREVVFCDPPYLMSTRTDRRLYKWEWWTDQHRQLLQLIITLPCRVMLSGYPSELYKQHLVGWNSINYDAMTRGGTTRDEWLWFNFPKPLELHDYRYLGEGYRERERIKKKKKRWLAKLKAMPALERQALLAAMQEVERA